MRASIHAMYDNVLLPAATWVFKLVFPLEVYLGGSSAEVVLYRGMTPSPACRQCFSRLGCYWRPQVAPHEALPACLRAFPYFGAPVGRTLQHTRLARLHACMEHFGLVAAAVECLFVCSLQTSSVVAVFNGDLC